MEKQDGSSMDELLQMVSSGLQACPVDKLPSGNSTEYPFSLSVHGAWMLQKGIEKYVQDTPGRSGDVYDCLCRYDTAMTVATKLREWCVEVAPDYLSFNIRRLDSLLGELKAEVGRLLDAQDRE